MKKGQPVPRGFHCLLYGSPGVGKTTLLSQLPKPCAILDLDDGSGWLYHNLKDVDIFTFEPGEDIASEAERFLKSAATGRGEAKDYRSIAIDSMSALRSRHLMYLVGDSLFYERGDYGIATNWLRRVLTMTQYAPQIIVWTSHMKRERDESRLLVLPAGLSDSAMNHCDELLDAIIFMGKRVGVKGEVNRYLTTEEVDLVAGRSTLKAKDRTGLLPGLIELGGLDEDGNPPNMVSPFFDDIIEELGLHKPLPTKKKPASKKKPAKKTK